jgi:hypothetical protein
VSRDRVFAFVTLAIAIAAVALMILGNDWEMQVGRSLWPLLVVVPLLAGLLRQRDFRRRSS